MTTNTEHSKVLIIGSALPATPPPFMQPALT